jgi:hypothetical protein
MPAALVNKPAIASQVVFPAPVSGSVGGRAFGAVVVSPVPSLDRQFGLRALASTDIRSIWNSIRLAFGDVAHHTPSRSKIGPEPAAPTTVGSWPVTFWTLKTVVGRR